MSWSFVEDSFAGLNSDHRSDRCLSAAWCCLLSDIQLAETSNLRHSLLSKVGEHKLTATDVSLLFEWTITQTVFTSTYFLRTEVKAQGSVVNRHIQSGAPT
ncbi:hypothetical protein CHARACLAT_032645 [Characodon lateralis]|uniref:Uncharacterized protein n=1 Tax=Characodon lateralis TaxID=208331 RepID=A0ABU7CTA5_9TELE|nr:hypothetical protein [Characodon lateralis]